MIADPIDDLLADLLDASVAPTPAQLAKAANREHPRGLATGIDSCEKLRKAANLDSGEAPADADSQEFAGLRRPPNGLQSEQGRGLSQDSQNSQGFPATKHIRLCAALPERRHQLARDEAGRCHAGGWDDAEMARFQARTVVIRRCGIGEQDAEDLAESLTMRDRDADDRRLCLECSHLGERGRCLAAAAGRLRGVGTRYEPVPTILQRCEAFGLRKGMP